MKRLFILLIVLISGFIAIVGNVNLNVISVENQTVETIAKLEKVEAAVADVTEVQKRLKKALLYEGQGQS